MRKKLFSLAAVVLFVGSSFNLNATQAIEEEFDACTDLALQVQTVLENNDVPKSVANEVASLVYEICTG